MSQIAKQMWVAAFTVVVLLPVGVFAQDSEPPTAIPGASSSLEDSVQRMRAVVESTLATMEADPAIEDSAKVLLRPKYEQAIKALKDAASSATKAAEFRESMTQAPDTTIELRDQLDQLPSVESASDVMAPANADDLQQALVAQRATLAALNDQLSSITADPSLAEHRPAEISVRIPEAQRELADVRNQLASPDLSPDNSSPGRVANRCLLQALELKLLSELEMLNREQLSQSDRRNLQRAQRELLTRQVENAQASVVAYQALVDQRVTEAAQDIGARANESRLEVSQEDKKAVALAAEVENLANQLENVLQDRQKISAAKTQVATKLTRLTLRYESIKTQLELDRPGPEMAQVLIELRALLLKRARAVAEMRQWPTLSQARLAAVQVDSKIEAQNDLQLKFADRSLPAVQELVAARRDVLAKLQIQYLDLIPILASLESDTNLYLDKAKEFRAEMTQRLFWIRNSSTISVSTLGELPSGLGWVFSREHGSECWGVLKTATARTPVIYGVVFLGALVLLLFRFRIGAALHRTGNGVGRVSTDRFGLTGKAVLWTALLALPIPLLVGLLTLMLAQASEPSTWLSEINRGMTQTLLVVSGASAFMACCYPGGLGDVHFGWRKEPLSWLRSGSHWFAFAYVPLALLANCTLSSESGRFLHSLGRASFLLALFWLLGVLVRLFFFSNAVDTTLAQENGNRPFYRSRHLWSVAAIGVLLGLIGFICFGYTMTTFYLSFTLVLTLIIVVCGVILYSIALRWFKIEHRRLAYAEALERRRARQEAAADEEQTEDSEEVINVDEDEQELDLDSVGEQTRYVLKLFFGLGIATMVLSLWSTTLPLIPYLDTITIPMTNFTLLELVKAVLIAGVTWLVTKNLPGMLELAVLRASSLETGTRHAITTICQYAVVAIGLVLFFNAVNLDWAKFGWIAGGLSVGIGFGLQEIVANFISGLIILFERPIRLGDVVTLDETTGTVTKIHMRSTTITNWDRHEYVVPNKNLVTGTILNWTLSAPLNRVIIPVGVAYGSDTEKARQILVDIAVDHPRVLDDPAPRAIFDQFADSSLSLELRAFLPDLDNRMGTITELHTEIMKRFAEAGIKIPFPQRDVHLKNGLDGPARESEREAFPIEIPDTR